MKVWGVDCMLSALGIYQPVDKIEGYIYSPIASNWQTCYIYLTNIIFSETDKLLLTLSNLTMYKPEEISLDGDQSIV